MFLVFTYWKFYKFVSHICLYFRNARSKNKTKEASGIFLAGTRCRYVIEFTKPILLVSLRRHRYDYDDADDETTRAENGLMKHHVTFSVTNIRTPCHQLDINFTAY